MSLQLSILESEVFTAMNETLDLIRLLFREVQTVPLSLTRQEHPRQGNSPLYQVYQKRAKALPSFKYLLPLLKARRIEIESRKQSLGKRPSTLKVQHLVEEMMGVTRENKYLNDLVRAVGARNSHFESLQSEMLLLQQKQKEEKPSLQAILEGVFQDRDLHETYEHGVMQDKMML